MLHNKSTYDYVIEGTNGLLACNYIHEDDDTRKNQWSLCTDEGNDMVKFIDWLPGSDIRTDESDARELLNIYECILEEVLSHSEAVNSIDSIED